MPTGKYVRRPSSPNPLTEAVRRCATEHMSMQETADELATRERPLNRNSIAGIAYRAKPRITFGDGPRTNHVQQAKPRTPRLPKPRQPKPRAEHAAPSSMFPNSFVIRSGQVKPRPLVSQHCQWHGCTAATENGSMFCYPHGRKPLL